MRVCLITYRDRPHGKTASVFARLRDRGIAELSVMFAPFQPRAKRVTKFQHRPAQDDGPFIRELCNSSGAETFDIAEFDRVEARTDWFLVCGASLLAPEITKSGRI